MPKATTPIAATRQARRHNPLEEDLLATGPLRIEPGKRKSRNEDDSEEKFVSSKASKKILRIGQELADEDTNEQLVARPNTAFDFESRLADEFIEDIYEDDEAWGDEEEIADEEELAPSDLETFSKFFPTKDDPLLQRGWAGETTEPEGQQGTNLADLILEKIAAHEAAQSGNGNAKRGIVGAPDDDYVLPPKVIEVYTKYG
jgi:essential nuclear protein 1